MKKLANSVPNIDPASTPSRKARITIQPLRTSKNHPSDPRSTHQDSALPVLNPPSCLLCLNKPAAVIYHPCSHGGICLSCAQKILGEKNICHLCREPVTSLYVVTPVSGKEYVVQRGYRLKHRGHAEEKEIRPRLVHSQQNISGGLENAQIGQE